MEVVVDLITMIFTHIFTHISYFEGIQCPSPHLYLYSSMPRKEQIQKKKEWGIKSFLPSTHVGMVVYGACHFPFFKKKVLFNYL